MRDLNLSFKTSSFLLILTMLVKIKMTIEEQSSRFTWEYCPCHEFIFNFFDDKVMKEEIKNLTFRSDGQCGNNTLADIQNNNNIFSYLSNLNKTLIDNQIKEKEAVSYYIGRGYVNKGKLINKNDYGINDYIEKDAFELFGLYDKITKSIYEINLHYINFLLIDNVTLCNMVNLNNNELDLDFNITANQTKDSFSMYMILKKTSIFEYFSKKANLFSRLINELLTILQLRITTRFGIEFNQNELQECDVDDLKSSSFAYKTCLYMRKNSISISKIRNLSLVNSTQLLKNNYMSNNEYNNKTIDYLNRLYKSINDSRITNTTKGNSSLKEEILSKSKYNIKKYTSIINNIKSISNENEDLLYSSLFKLDSRINPFTIEGILNNKSAQVSSNEIIDEININYISNLSYINVNSTNTSNEIMNNTSNNKGNSINISNSSLSNKISILNNNSQSLNLFSNFTNSSNSNKNDSNNISSINNKSSSNTTNSNLSSLMNNSNSTNNTSLSSLTQFQNQSNTSSIQSQTQQQISSLFPKPNQNSSFFTKPNQTNQINQTKSFQNRRILQEKNSSSLLKTNFTEIPFDKSIFYKKIITRYICNNEYIFAIFQYIYNLQSKLPEDYIIFPIIDALINIDSYKYIYSTKYYEHLLNEYKDIINESKVSEYDEFFIFQKGNIISSLINYNIPLDIENLSFEYYLIKDNDLLFTVIIDYYNKEIYINIDFIDKLTMKSSLIFNYGYHRMKVICECLMFNKNCDCLEYNQYDLIFQGDELKRILNETCIYSLNLYDKINYNSKINIEYIFNNTNNNEDENNITDHINLSSSFINSYQNLKLIEDVNINQSYNGSINKDKLKLRETNKKMLNMTLLYNNTIYNKTFMNYGYYDNCFFNSSFFNYSQFIQSSDKFEAIEVVLGINEFKVFSNCRICHIFLFFIVLYLEMLIEF